MSIGEKLKKARLGKSLSLGEVYRQTKIQLHILEALEQDQGHRLLEPVYLRSFMKTYAQYLGIDAQEILNEHSRHLKPKIVSSEIILEKRHSMSSKLKPILILRVILAIAVVIFLVFHFRATSKQISQGTPEYAKPKIKVHLTPATPQVKPGSLGIDVKALDNCWMRVKVDKQELFQGTLLKGKTEHWQARERIELRIGKPEALEVRLNGKIINLKTVGVKKRLIITHEGVSGK